MTEAEIIQLIVRMEKEDERIAHEIAELHPEWDVIWKRLGFFHIDEGVSRE